MKTRVIILAGGEGSRLSILTAKRTKPAVPFGGKYRIIDFALSNCVNSRLYDVMIIAQYRPHSLIEHIGAGGPWDLNRDFTGGARIYTPYKARGDADWFTGTADAVQQNFTFIKSTNPELLLILSGDHIYQMDYDALIAFHLDHQADMTMGVITVAPEEASRFGIVGFDADYRVNAFVEKPSNPPSNLANMGVYLFNCDVLNRYLREDHTRPDSSHDFGKDILPRMIAEQARVFAFPYSGYWVDVGTTASYWQAHMDLLADPPSMDLNNREWVVHTRTEERPPARIASGADICDSLITDGCVIAAGAHVENSVLSPGVRVETGAVVCQSVILTDSVIGPGAQVTRAILDKRVHVGANARLGAPSEELPPKLTLIGKNSQLPENIIIEPGALIGADVIPPDFDNLHVPAGAYVQTRRLPHEI